MLVLTFRFGGPLRLTLRHRPRVSAVVREASGLRSLTVVGPTLAMADAFATAAFAMGEPGIAWVARQPGYGALGITTSDRMVWTPLVEELLVSPRDDPADARDESVRPLTPLSGDTG